MCGRYSLFGPVSIPRDAVRVLNEMNLELDRALNSRPADINAAPTDLLPVVTQSKEGGYECEDLKWGLVPHWAKDTKIGAKLINARAEAVTEKPHSAPRSRSAAALCLRAATSNGRASPSKSSLISFMPPTANC